jgi:hypothetical protein
VDDLALLAQQVERRLVLGGVELVGVLDAELGLVAHQVERGVGDVDRPVERLDSALVRLAVRELLLLEHDAPGLRRLALEGLLVVHQHVATPLVGHAVVLAVDRMPGHVLEPGVHRPPRGDQRGVHLLHRLARDQAQRGVARGGDEVEAALVHEGHHLVRRARGLDVDLAAGALLEAGDPVVGLVRLAALDVAGPGHDIDRPLARPERLERRRGDPRRRQNRRRDSRRHELLASCHPRPRPFLAADHAAAGTV